MLSLRPYYWKLYLNNGTMFSIFGNNFIKKWYLDNFYIYILVDYGIIGYIIYAIIYYNSLKKLKNDDKLTLIIFVFLIYGIFETNVIIGSIQFAFAIQIKSLIENKRE